MTKQLNIAQFTVACFQRTICLSVVAAYDKIEISRPLLLT